MTNILTDKINAISKISDNILRRKKVTTVKYIHVYKPTYLVNKFIPKLDLRFWLGKLVQLGFVIHMQYLTKFYCSISFALQYIRNLSDFF